MDTTIGTLVRGIYQIQKLRIQAGNRIVANFKSKLGQEPSEPEEDLSEDSLDTLKILRLEYNRITDGVVKIKLKDFVGSELINSYSEFCLIEQYLSLESNEKKQFSNLESILEEYKIYTSYLKGIRGIGPAMAAVLISKIDIRKARHVSSLWKYAGLDVGEDGRGRSKRTEHLIDKPYIDSEGEEKLKKSITYEPFLKTKLMGVLGPSLIRARNEKYTKVYYDYKNRLEQHAVHREKTKGHRNMMAIRYMVKMFLADLYVAWRTLEGLPVSVPYHEAKLGMVHGGERAAA